MFKKIYDNETTEVCIHKDPKIEGITWISVGMANILPNVIINMLLFL